MQLNLKPFLKSLREKKKSVQEILADLKEPHLWYPEARAIKRKFILHTGPTNSGKTHHALERLKSADSGVYCGPLRLLAQEVYEKLADSGVECSMLTGQIRIVNPNAKHISCTIELANTEEMVEVAVIDEFQLISDSDRGLYWTRAILGIPALEIHLCGDGSSKELIRKICEITGDSYELRTYERLSPLEIEERPASISKLQKGDCLVTFSKKECIELKQQMESKGKRCAIVYGSLPPIIRLQEAKRFNDTDDAEILIATDCIGMGLNLNISRVIFTSTFKYDGRDFRKLKSPELRQIAGRAGRFKSDFNSCGKVSAFDRTGLDHIRKAFAAREEENKRAGLFPPAEQLELFGENIAKNSTKFSEILKSFVLSSNIDQHYFLCYFDRFLIIAEHLDEIKMSIPDKYLFICSPFQIHRKKAMFFLKSFAFDYSEGKTIPFPFNQSHMVEGHTANSTLECLEDLYAISDGYLWLAHQFPESFNETNKAQKYIQMVTKEISEKLKTLPFNKLAGFSNVLKKDN
ncbi:hypothetical protein DICPUDRAFT_33488 [Dictyostelium purpureum]|uniref:RNA helicase n=1 Tax=Dictyostelium purpureum TaxID=5786 RepID=F0ZKX9_DICPU|nr:uncharacterized protein DICPUDRAFT_33488 [Dictyostelium purpureum]EGC35393.1 hypothetical protein DICPUDRAFT_33488 [Dictyostelium purpureum]|eukprot:XP_003288069.1 hypothetical protein DICPUDRAFT_33488 [Dictyostelium purpureum]